jgi:hypothetical protein
MKKKPLASKSGPEPKSGIADFTTWSSDAMANRKRADRADSTSIAWRVALASPAAADRLASGAVDAAKPMPTERAAGPACGISAVVGGEPLVRATGPAPLGGAIVFLQQKWSEANAPVQTTIAKEYLLARMTNTSGSSSPSARSAYSMANASLENSSTQTPK